MSYFALVSAETKLCHRYPVEHNEYLFIEAREHKRKPAGESFDSKNLIQLHNHLAEKYGKKPTILIVRPAVKWWQFWRWF